MRLPPPLLVRSSSGTGARSASTGEVAARGPQAEMALAFGEVLFAVRSARGFEEPLTLYGGVDRPKPSEGQIWIPHVCCVDELSRPALVWEKCSEQRIEEKLGAGLNDLDRWSRQPRALLR